MLGSGGIQRLAQCRDRAPGLAIGNRAASEIAARRCRAVDIVRSMAATQARGRSHSVEPCRILPRRIAADSGRLLLRAVATGRPERSTAVREESRSAGQCRPRPRRIVAGSVRLRRLRAVRCLVDRRARRNEAIRGAIGTEPRRVRIASVVIPTATDGEVLVRNSICVNRSCGSLRMETAIRAADIVRRATVAREVFPVSVDRDRAMADRVAQRPATEAEVVVLPAVVGATSVEAVAVIRVVVAAVDTPAEAEVVTPVVEATADIAKPKLL